VFRRLRQLSFFAFLISASALASPLLLHNPSLSKDKIAFRYADDVWIVSRDGGEAQRLTSTASLTAGPFFSPDGSRIAYSTNIHGNDDV